MPLFCKHCGAFICRTPNGFWSDGDTVTCSVGAFHVPYRRDES